MSRTVSWITALALLLALAALFVQHGSHALLRRQNQAITAELMQLRAEADFLSNRNAQAVVPAAPSLRTPQLRELLKLRGEVALLRRQRRDLEHALSTAASTSGTVSSAPASWTQPPAPEPFKLQLVLDQPGEDSEGVTNNAAGSGGEALVVQKTPLLDSSAIRSARVTTDPALGTPQIDIEFSEEGKELFAQITRENMNKRLAIVLNGQLYSAPVIRTEIPSGKAVITGNFSDQEAQALVSKISEAIPEE